MTDLISRYGGEEFAVLLNNINLETGSKIAEKVRAKIEDTDFFIPDQKEPLKKTTSIGIAEYNKNETIEDFISRADKALYQAKETGRNKIVAG